MFLGHAHLNDQYIIFLPLRRPLLMTSVTHLHILSNTVFQQVAKMYNTDSMASETKLSS